MNNAELVETPQWFFGSMIGYEDHPLFTINSEIIIHTWIIMIFLALLLASVNYILHYTTLGRFILLKIVSFFIDLTKQSLGSFVYSHCVFASSLFIFIALCNTASLVPYLDEPTRDLNTAIALGTISFLYIQTVTIKSRGIYSYIKDFFQPFFVMLPLNIVGKLSSIISISFRLFGNIFGGAIITKLYFSSIRGSIILELLGLFSGANFLIVAFFTLFEGLLQAFVFAMLTLTYLSIGTQEGGH
ncbi:MAG TPA: FoF1 ATP synthase subunit a [Candidatus Babeliales bacterium]|nr:FoF1 ATP synthase subunit a [Candidatus Babeliales bacterium]